MTSEQTLLQILYRSQQTMCLQSDEMSIFCQKTVEHTGVARQYQAIPIKVCLAYFGIFSCLAAWSLQSDIEFYEEGRKGT